MTTTHTPNAAEPVAWERVTKFLATADSIAFDGCHKIYIHRDALGTKRSRENGYGDRSDKSELIMVRGTPGLALGHVKSWFEESCGLRFINGIIGSGDDYNHYVRLIEQGAEDDWTDLAECTCYDLPGDAPCEKHG